jgi:chloride channel 3/4/5
MYDEPLLDVNGDEVSDSDAKINGIRVWYTSYTSIDWLHDAIKDSLRFSKLRRRKSWRSRIRLLFDKSLGWIIVTIVGFLSAVVAFLVVRSEQWLFDLKEGYCTTSVWKSKSFCCPGLEPGDFAIGVGSKRFEKLCSTWRPWYQVLSPYNTDNADEVVEYISYTVIAVSCHESGINNR